jgi:hypothetical protein
MTTLTRLIAAATLMGATAFSPGLASADDRHERSDRRDVRAEPCDRHDHGGRALPPPAWATRDDLRWDGREWIHAGWGRAERSGRFEQARAVRHELRLLEWERAEFHARFAGHPRRLARFDAQYVRRRDELERRLQWVTLYAWR